jgi:hypothetical protein
MLVTETEKPDRFFRNTSAILDNASIIIDNANAVIDKLFVYLSSNATANLARFQSYSPSVVPNKKLGGYHEAGNQAIFGLRRGDSRVGCSRTLRAGLR